MGFLHNPIQKHFKAGLLSRLIITWNKTKHKRRQRENERVMNVKKLALFETADPAATLAVQSGFARQMSELLISEFWNRHHLQHNTLESAVTDYSALKHFTSGQQWFKSWVTSSTDTPAAEMGRQLLWVTLSAGLTSRGSSINPTSKRTSIAK